MDHVSLSSRHQKTISDRAAALGNDGFELDGAMDHDTDTAFLYKLIIKKEEILSGIPGTAGYPAQYRREGKFLLEEAEKGVCRRREWFSQQYEKWGVFNREE